MVVAGDLLSKNFVSVDVGTPLSKLAGKLKGENAALVFQNEKYLGVVDRHVFAHKRVDLSKTKVGNILKRRSKANSSLFVPTIRKKTSIKETGRLMAAAGCHLLPIVEKSKIQGVVRAKDIAVLLASDERCEDYATFKICTVNETDKIGKLLTILGRNNIDHVPVVDKQGRLAGMVATIDVLKRYVWLDTCSQRNSQSATHQGKHSGHGQGEKKRPLNVPVSNLMSSESHYLSPQASLKRAVALMRKKNISSVVLVENNRPVGILTFKDILTKKGRRSLHRAGEQGKALKTLKLPIA